MIKRRITTVQIVEITFMRIIEVFMEMNKQSAKSYGNKSRRVS